MNTACAVVIGLALNWRCFDAFWRQIMDSNHVNNWRRREAGVMEYNRELVE